VRPQIQTLQKGLIRCPALGSISPTALGQFRCVVLDPAPDRDMIYVQMPFSHEFFQIAIAERVPKVPTDTEDDDFRVEISTFEQGRSRLPHGLPSVSDRINRHCNTSVPAVELADLRDPWSG
jgi:hypothetical protein